MALIRGKLHLFACRSGETYAQKLSIQLTHIISKRAKQLNQEKNLNDHEQNELEFIKGLGPNGVQIGKAKVMQFDDGEMNIMLDENENIRDKDVFLVQSPFNKNSGLSINTNIMETFLYIDALRRAKARTITLISLHFPYGRGDKEHAKDGIPAKVIVNLLTHSGLDNLITMDLHAEQIIGFFDADKVHVEHLKANPLLVHYLKKNIKKTTDTKIASPDAGGAKRAQTLAKALKTGMVLAYKKRNYEKKHVIDELKLLGLPGKGDVIIVDDIVASGGSVIKVIELLKQKGVQHVSIACSHPLLINDAIKKFDTLYKNKENPFIQLIGTDSIPQPKEVLKKEWYIEIDTSRFVAKAIYEAHTSGSISQLHEANCVGELNLWAD